MTYEADAEGFREGAACPDCGSTDTITFHYREGFDEVECPHCGFRSDALELDSLTRFSADLLESDAEAKLPIPRRSIQA